MKKQDSLKFVAIFIAVIIISLPIYTSNVYAATTATVTRNSGEDGVEDVMRTDDVWHLEVNAKVDGWTVTPDHIFYDAAYHDFGSCQPYFLYNPPYCQTPSCQVLSDGSTQCSVAWNFSLGLAEQRKTHFIEVYDQNWVPTKFEFYTDVDGSAPVLTDVQAQQVGTEAEISFTVEEEPAYCAGLEKIEIYDGNATSPIEVFNAEDLIIANKCGANNMKLSVALSAGDLNRALRIKAYDKLGYIDTAVTPNFLFDSSNPIFGSEDLILMENGRELPGYVTEGVHTVDVHVNIAETSSTLSVTATALTYGLDAVSGNCHKSDVLANIWTCVWPNVAINFVGTTDVTLALEADDGFQITQQTVSATFNVDGQAPIVNSFTTAVTHEGNSFVRTLDNVFKAEIQEAQSGISRDDIAANFLPIGDISASCDQGGKKADSCNETGTGAWTCYWNNVEATQSGTVAMCPIRDIAGNSQLNVPLLDVFVDNDAPEISEIKVVAVGAEGERRYLQDNDIVKVEFQATDVNGVSATLDLTKIYNSGAANDGLVDAV
jgi:hypothetical protein